MTDMLKVKPHKADHHLGSIEAPVVVVQYGDYECPYCAETLPWIDHLLRDFRGDVCFIFRHYPLIDLHPNAAFAAAASEIASKHNLFWKMHHTLFQNQLNLSGESIVQMARSMNMNVEAFLKESDDEHIMDIICQDIVDGTESGVKEAPSYFINGRKTSIGRNYESLKAAVEEVLKGQSQRGHSPDSTH